MRKTSFQSIAEFMNPISPADSMRQLWEAHRHIESEPISLRTIYERHSSPHKKTARFLCYNTWLLRSPVGDKPVIPYRAYLIGKELSQSNYDIAALTEVFEEDDAQIIKKSSSMKYTAAGHQGSFISSDFEFFDSGGGLYTLSQLKIIGKPNLLKFINDGGSNVADAWAQKGVLHIEANLGAGNIDLYSTHLIYGTTFPLDDSIPEIYRDMLRYLQVKELTNFIAKTHKPKNIAVISGDFNIDADSSNDFHPSLENKLAFTRFTGSFFDFDERIFNVYTETVRLLSNINLDKGGKTDFYDLWYKKGRKNGGTNNSFKRCKKRYTDASIYCDDSIGVQSGRIDYVFIEKPNKFHSFNLDTTILRRRPFPLPNLKLHEIIDMLVTVGITPDLKEVIEKHFNINLDVTFKFSASTRRAVELISRNGNLKQLVNNFLIREIRVKGGRSLDEAKHLSDHIGLDTIFIASPK